MKNETWNRWTRVVAVLLAAMNAEANPDERLAAADTLREGGNHAEAYAVSYRLRAEIPGQYSALPARASAMHAPELKANSDEFKLSVRDR